MRREASLNLSMLFCRNENSADCWIWIVQVYTMNEKAHLRVRYSLCVQLTKSIWSILTTGGAA